MGRGLPGTRNGDAVVVIVMAEEEGRAGDEYGDDGDKGCSDGGDV